MTSGAISRRPNAYDEANHAARDAAGNAAEYVRRVRALRQREAVSQVRDELRRRVPVRAWGRVEWVLLCGAAGCAALALIVSTMGVFS